MVASSRLMVHQAADFTGSLLKVYYAVTMYSNMSSNIIVLYFCTAIDFKQGKGKGNRRDG